MQQLQDSIFNVSSGQLNQSRFDTANRSTFATGPGLIGSSATSPPPPQQQQRPSHFATFAFGAPVPPQHQTLSTSSIGLPPLNASTTTGTAKTMSRFVPQSVQQSVASTRMFGGPSTMPSDHSTVAPSRQQQFQQPTRAVPPSTTTTASSSSSYVGPSIRSGLRSQPPAASSASAFSVSADDGDIPTESLLDDIGAPSAPKDHFIFQDGQSYLRAPIHRTGRYVDIPVASDQQLPSQMPHVSQGDAAKTPIPTRTDGGPSTSAVSARASRLLTSPSQINPFFDADEDNTLLVESESAALWVTVFGFPQSKADYVFKEFSSYGEIVDYQTANGNWIHLRYSNRFQAQKALSKNGKIFEGVLMLGVLGCLDQKVLSRRSRRRIAPTSTITTRSHLQKRSLSEITPSANRPLAVSQGVPPAKRPRPERTVWSAISDYIFNW